MSTFSDWLTSQLKERKMSPAELSRLIKKDQSVISRILSGERSPANETLDAIAKALKLPPTQVFEAAGILPPKAGEDPWVEQMDLKLRSIKDPNKREIAEKMLDALIDENASKKAVSPKKNLSTGKA
jgi:transcriptional regulator with XRE-family HTH domain